MNIENAGASYEYIPGHEVHDSTSFAIGLSGLDLTSADAFAYSFGKAMASSAASMGVGMLASEAGLGGFVSTIAASLAGAYVNMELSPEKEQTSTEQDKKPKLPNISSNSTVSYEHNGRGFRAVNIDFGEREFATVINKIKENIFTEALDKGSSIEETVGQIHETVEQFTHEVEAEHTKIDETAEAICEIDERIKSKTRETSSNQQKAEALVEGIKSINEKQVKLESRETEKPVEGTSIQTQIEFLSVAKQKYLSDLSRIEQEEKVQHANEAVRSRKVLRWSELDDPTLANADEIKLPNETEIRQASDQQVSREFQRHRDIIEADYRAQVRFARGEGFTKPAPISAPLVGISVSIEQINSPENRLKRLRQEELGKIGENSVQQLARVIPGVGPAIDYHYDRISEREFYGSLGIDAVSIGVPGGVAKGITGIKATIKAQFARNLSGRYTLSGRVIRDAGSGKTRPWLRKGENPSARPSWQQSEIDDMLRLRASGQVVESQVSFLNGRPCRHGTPGSIRVDSWVDGRVAHEMKNYDLTSNVNGLIHDVTKQAIKHQQHLPAGTRQIFKIDARGQVLTPELHDKIVTSVVSKTDGILRVTDIEFIGTK